MHAVRELAKTELPSQVKLTYLAEVLLTRDAGETPTMAFTPPAMADMPISAAAIYDVYFHGPAYQVLERVQVQDDTATGLLAEELPPHTNPAGVVDLIAPRLVELCFQTAGVWDIHTNGRMGLPSSIGQVTAYRRMADAAGKRLYAVVKAHNNGSWFEATVVDEAGNVYVELHGYFTVELPGRVSLKEGN